MRKCRKCKINKIIENRKFCNDCKIKPKNCICGNIFKSKKHEYCNNCRKSKGKNGICLICNQNRFIYAQSCCTTCYRFLSKYKITTDQLIELRKIKNCQLCGIEVCHHIGNGNGRAVIDHCHESGKVRGILCAQCNIIEGMLRDDNHLECFYKNYKDWINKVT